MTTDQPTNQTAPTPRPGARVQTWWCEGCRLWHQAEPILAAVKAEAEKVGAGKGIVKTMKTAVELRKLSGFEGDARLYELSEPISYDYDYDTEKYKSATRFVVVSAASVMLSGPETYIFPGDAEGSVISWSELDGSFKGGLNHARALENAGYVVGASEKG